jgi:hypothetical protein
MCVAEGAIIVRDKEHAPIDVQLLDNPSLRFLNRVVHLSGGEVDELGRKVR